jgi:hypothetical protein
MLMIHDLIPGELEQVVQQRLNVFQYFEAELLGQVQLIVVVDPEQFLIALDEVADLRVSFLHPAAGVNANVAKPVVVDRLLPGVGGPRDPDSYLISAFSSS